MLFRSVSLCLLLIILNTTTPLTAGPFGILVVFCLSYLLSLGVVAFFIYWVNQLFHKLSNYFMTSRPYVPLTFRRSYHYSTIFGFVPILLVSLQSVGAVGLYGLILVVLFVGIGCLYVSKITR